MKNINLSTYFKMYKQGVLSEYTLCSEIENKIASTVRTTVKLIEGKNNFLVACMPVKSMNGYKIEVLIDKQMVNGTIITVEEIDKMIEALYYEEQEILYSFSSELKKLKSIDLSLGDIIKIYLKMYRLSLKAIPVGILEKVEKSNIAGLAKVDDYILNLETTNPKVTDVIEELSINGIMPLEYIAAAKELAAAQTKDVYHVDHDKVSVNQLEKEIEGVTNDYSDRRQIKEIKHDYKPTTNY